MQVNQSTGNQYQNLSTENLNRINKTDYIKPNSESLSVTNAIVDQIDIKDLKGIENHTKWFDLNSPELLVENTLDAVLSDDPIAAMRQTVIFQQELDNMSAGELEETRDYIVHRMAQEADPQAREALMELYNMVDAESEEPFPGFPKYPIKPTPKIPFPLTPPTFPFDPMIKWA